MTTVPDPPATITCYVCRRSTSCYRTLWLDGLQLCEQCVEEARERTQRVVNRSRHGDDAEAAEQFLNDLKTADLSEALAETLRQEWLDSGRNNVLFVKQVPPPLNGAGLDTIAGFSVAETLKLASACAECGSEGWRKKKFVGGVPLCEECRAKVSRIANPDEVRERRDYERILRTTEAGRILDVLWRPEERAALVKARGNVERTIETENRDFIPAHVKIADDRSGGAIPGRGADLDRWRETWRLIRPHAERYRPDEIKKWLEINHASRTASTKTLRRIITAGRAGLL